MSERTVWSMVISITMFMLFLGFISSLVETKSSVKTKNSIQVLNSTSKSIEIIIDGSNTVTVPAGTVMTFEGRI